MSKDGGPAFPEVFSTYSNEDRTLTDVYSAGGMSLRDYFAAKAMQAAISTLTGEPTETAPVHCGPIARDAYEMADAMLKERDKPSGDKHE